MRGRKRSGGKAPQTPLAHPGWGLRLTRDAGLRTRGASVNSSRARRALAAQNDEKRRVLVGWESSPRLEPEGLLVAELWQLPSHPREFLTADRGEPG